MAKYNSRKGSSGLDPMGFFLDLAGAAAMGAYTKYKIKKDFARGEGHESARAAAMVFGMGSMRRGTAGMVNLGGLVGLNSALKDIDKQRSTQQRVIRSSNMSPNGSLHIPHRKFKVSKKPYSKNMWRKYCRDGSQYGLSPFDYETADEYEEALKIAEASQDPPIETCKTEEKKKSLTTKKHVWRNYCKDGTSYGIKPEDYDSADEYYLALEEAISKASNSTNEDEKNGL